MLKVEIYTSEEYNELFGTSMGIDAKYIICPVGNNNDDCAEYPYAGVVLKDGSCEILGCRQDMKEDIISMIRALHIH